MKRKILGFSIIVLTIFSTLLPIASVAAEKEINIKLYWNNECTEEVANIDWGNVYSGYWHSRRIYIKNEGDVHTGIFLNNTNWDDFYLEWTPHDQLVLEPNEVCATNLTMFVYWDAPKQSFNFNTTLNFDVVADVNNDGKVCEIDAGIVNSHYNEKYEPYLDVEGDVNRDGIVSGFDLISVVNLYGKSYSRFKEYLPYIREEVCWNDTKCVIDGFDMTKTCGCYGKKFTIGWRNWDCNNDKIIDDTDVDIVASDYGFQYVGKEITLESKGTVTGSMERGVNWIATSWAHVEQDLLERDFAKFENDGLRVVSLPVHLSMIYNGTEIPNENTTYSDDVLDNLVEAILRAKNHNLKVLVTIYTSFSHIYKARNPAWMKDPCDNTRGAKCIVGSNEMAQGYLNQFEYIVDYVALHSDTDISDVWAWAVMNEPHPSCPLGNPNCPYCGGKEARRNRGCDLMVNLSNCVKKYPGSGHPTCRFIPQLMGDEGWKWDDRLFTAFPAIFMLSGYNETNYYDPIVETLNRDRIVFIYEFGKDDNNDTSQAEHYEYHLRDFIMLGVKGCFAFEWVPNSQLGQRFNICANAAGDGRPAYNKLAKSM